AGRAGGCGAADRPRAGQLDAAAGRAGAPGRWRPGAAGSRSRLILPRGRRSMRIYTKTGDAGQTGLFGGGRVGKAHPRVEAYGAVDELNAMIGWALTQVTHGTVAERLARVQPELFVVGAHLATSVPEGR